MTAAQRQVRGIVEQARVWTAEGGFFDSLAAEGAEHDHTPPAEEPCSAT